MLVVEAPARNTLPFTDDAVWALDVKLPMSSTVRKQTITLRFVFCIRLLLEDNEIGLRWYDAEKPSPHFSP